jgi:hypothetical protein
MFRCAALGPKVKRKATYSLLWRDSYLLWTEEVLRDAQDGHLRADRGAHRSTHMAPHLIERPTSGAAPMSSSGRERGQSEYLFRNTFSSGSEPSTGRAALQLGVRRLPGQEAAESSEIFLDRRAGSRTFQLRTTRVRRRSAIGAATQRSVMTVLAAARRTIAFIVPKLSSQSITPCSRR